MYRRHSRLTVRHGWLAGFLALCLAAVLPLASCGNSHDESGPRLELSSTSGQEKVSDYVIGPLDKLSIRVFQAKELSLDGVQVDASGQIVLPLIGSVRAAGRTTNELSKDIADKLGERYLQSPEVSVVVEDAASQKVTVEGEVKSPGVFKMSGRTTLMQALAMAGGPNDDAELTHVAVIRVVNGTRRVAVCDYSAIRSGAAPDPLLVGEDVIIMDGSNAKIAWNSILKSLPVFALFSYFG